MKKIPTSTDTIVIGAGIIGLTTAMELSKSGRNVCVIDRGRVGGQCSWAGGGMLASLPPDQPCSETAALLAESLQIFPEFCAELARGTGIDPEYWVCGARVTDEHGERWLPDVAQVRNPRLLKALHRALEQRSVSVIEHVSVDGFATAQSRLCAIRTSAGSIECGSAVLAAGAWSSMLGSVLVTPAKGQMLLLEGAPNMLDHIRMNSQAYIIPRRDGHILVGSTVEDAGFCVAPTSLALSHLMHQLSSLWPEGRTLTLKNHWAGLRPKLTVQAPFIAPDEKLRGLYYNTGHFRLGITLSLASARRLVKLMT